MTIKSFAELTNQVHLLNDLILSDIIYAKGDYAEEFLTFNRHVYAMKMWFARTASANKRRYVLALVEDTRSMWALSMLLKALWNCRPKDAILSASQYNILTCYDKTPMDHNRTALPLKTLGQIMTSDRKWFNGLEPESQTVVLSELLTIAGGPIMWEVLRRGQLIYERQRDFQLRNILGSVVVEEQQESSKVDSEKKKSSPNLNAQQEPHKDLEASLAAWNAVIKSIRDNQKLEEIEMTFRDGSQRKIWKVNRPKPEVTETVDFLQLLPSCVGKKILSYLPPQTLQDYSRVNRYWAFLIEELRSELMMRQKLDNELQKLTLQLLPSCVGKKILSYLPPQTLQDYSRVNRYWAFLIEELRSELMMRQKLDNELQKLTELMVKHDVSIEMLSPASKRSAITASMAPSASITTRGLLAIGVSSVRASEKSPGGVSFRHGVVDRLKTHKIKPRPIQKVADLHKRLERRGAADENLWRWCKNVIKYTKSHRLLTKKSEEGVLNLVTTHFPCPLMKYSVEIPLREPLSQDPAQSTLGMPVFRKNISCVEAIPKEHSFKRYNLWSRDFSSLYKVYKVASYEYPSFNDVNGLAQTK